KLEDDDLTQSRQIRVAVDAIRRARAARLQESHAGVVMECANGHAREPRELAHAVRAFSRDSRRHAPIINPDVRLESSARTQSPAGGGHYWGGGVVVAGFFAPFFLPVSAPFFFDRFLPFFGVV